MAKRGRRVASESQSGGSLSGLSVHELKRELSRRQRNLTALHRRRSSMMDKIKALDVEIAGLGGVIGAGPDGVRRRPRNDKNLIEALTEALSGKTMSVTDVAEDVQRRGYVTTSPSFRTIVNQTLINSGKFKRISRGQYTAK